MMDKNLLYTPEEIAEYETVLRQNEMDMEKLLSDIQFVMSDSRGRRVINWILEVTQPFANHFDQNLAVTSHKQGKAYIGSLIHQALMKKCPQLMIQMLNEYRSAINSKLQEKKKHV